MNWREERRLLNNWLRKKAPVSKAAEHIIHQKARTIRKRKKVEANRRWRKMRKSQYRVILKRAKAARALKQQSTPSPRKARQMVQVCAIRAFFLCHAKT